ncbi:uncharacterized protein LOC142332777 [Lycorma delicatula]|uniref:uncharacterized protein LOC142332777 n=1 Tax=Lycorma delicatula TaxID=130591 RepID=UPI003F50F328
MLEKPVHCWKKSQKLQEDFTSFFLQELGTSVGDALGGKNTNNDTVSVDKMAARFHILNLVPEKTTTHNSSNERQESREWRWVGEIIGHSAVKLESVVWPGGHLVPASTPRGARSVFRVVTALAPPFVMEGELDEDGQCLRGLECHRLLTSDKDNLTLVFNEMDRLEDAEDNVDMNQKYFWGMSVNYHPRYRYLTSCCYGLAMDLLENIAQELEFDFHLYLVADGMHGSRTPRPDGGSQWNGIVGDLVSGAAHMSFAALSVSSPRSEVIDFSVPYFFSGVSFLASPDKRTDIPLLAFLLPFSSELWIAIFTSLNVTAVAVAIYEWLSPFGLNPWGRQRSKNFSMSSALWVCWGLLCGHLVAFKAPKSWPNKFLINVWGGFSVIFVASYTANIAALIAGLFFHNSVGDYHDRSLLSQRVGTPKASAADYYVHKANQLLWEHMQRYSVKDVAEGVQHLKNGSLDILIADTPILDYYRATDHGCKLQKIGDTINEDTYAVGMTKGFPLKDSISAVIAKYSSNGYMDILQEKWYGGLPCFKLVTEMAQPRPLGVAAVAGVFLLLGLGMVVGCLILLAEHLFYRYTLPILRHKPKGTIWRSRNIMFFSQKLYRFINCVELVSPHHAARELVHTIRQGQITSLFQKSVKRKEHEQRRRRKSKAQFFEMIQEIRRVQQEERVSSLSPPHLSLPVGEKGKNSPRMKKSQQSKSPTFLSPPDQQRRNSKLPTRLELARRLSRDVFRSKSSGNLRRMGSDISMAAGRFLDCHSSQAIGRRLSRDTNNSPPDINSRRASYLSDNRRLHSSDIGSASDLSAPPRSPNYLTAKPSLCTVIPAMQSFDYSTDNILTPSSLMPKSPDIIGTSKKFSYVDVKSPSFKNKLSKFHDTSSSSVDINPKVIIHSDNQTRDKWANSSINTTEHLIEIIIPPEKESSLKNSVEQKHPLNFVLDELKERQKEGALSTPVTLEKPTSSPTALTPTSDTLPKIVSYIPKKPIRKSESVGGAGSSESGTKSGGVTKKERRRAVHKFRSEDYSGGEDVCSSIIFPRKKCEKNDRSPCGKCDLCERTRGDKDGNTSPLSRLSREELLSLSQIPDTELKQHLLQAIEDKESPSVNFINKT